LIDNAARWGSYTPVIGTWISLVECVGIRVASCEWLIEGFL